MATAVLYTMPDSTRASRVVRELREAGFPNSDLAVPEANDREYGTRVLRCAAVCAAVGCVLGGTVGWVVGLAGMAPPSGDSPAASGAFVPLLIGAFAGAAAGSLTGSVIGLGLRSSRARLYLSRLRKGSVLVSVQSVEPGDTSSVERILARAGGVRVTTVGDVETPDQPAESVVAMPSDRTPPQVVHASVTP